MNILAPSQVLVSRIYATVTVLPRQGVEQCLNKCTKKKNTTFRKYQSIPESRGQLSFFVRVGEAEMVVVGG